MLVINVLDAGRLPEVCALQMSREALIALVGVLGIEQQAEQTSCNYCSLHHAFILHRPAIRVRTLG
jgi:hypothetical protein